MAELKKDADGKVVIDNGLPVWVLDDGKEMAIDGPHVHATIGKVRKERDEAEEKAKGLERQLRLFGGSDEEIKEAAEKLKAVGNMDLVKIEKAGKIDEEIANRVKTHMEASEVEKKALKDQLEALNGKLRNVLISSRFGSTPIANSLYLTPDAIEAMFANHFTVEGDEVVAYHDPATRREKIYSKKDPNKLAGFDEALEVVVTGHQNYKKWKKPQTVTGGDAPGGETGVAASGGGDLSSLPPEERLSRAFAAPKAN